MSEASLADELGFDSSPLLPSQCDEGSHVPVGVRLEEKVGRPLPLCHFVDSIWTLSCIPD